jgi:hypothetical protein
MDCVKREMEQKGVQFGCDDVPSGKWQRSNIEDDCMQGKLFKAKEE